MSRCRRVGLRRHRDARRAGVLQHVGERLLGDAVEGRLHPAEGGRPTARTGRRPRSPRCSSTMSRSRSIAGTRPKSSSAAGRSSTASRPDVLQRRDDELAEFRHCGSILVARRRRSSSDFNPRRIEVRACPVSSCSSRASRARSSSCASTTRRTASRLTRWESATAVAARAASDSVSLTSSSVKLDVGRPACRGRPRPRSDSTLGEKRDVQRRANAHPASDLLVHLGVVEHGVDTLAASRAGARVRSSSHRARARRRRGRMRRSPRRRLRRCGDGSRPASGKSDEDEPGGDEIAESSCDEAEERLELELAPASASPISPRDSRWRSQRVRGLVESRVLDRNGGLGGKQLRQLLVLVA